MSPVPWVAHCFLGLPEVPVSMWILAEQASHQHSSQSSGAGVGWWGKAVERSSPHLVAVVTPPCWSQRLGLQAGEDSGLQAGVRCWASQGSLSLRDLSACLRARMMGQLSGCRCSYSEVSLKPLGHSHTCMVPPNSYKSLAGTEPGTGLEIPSVVRPGGLHGTNTPGMPLPAVTMSEWCRYRLHYPSGQ